MKIISVDIGNSATKLLANEHIIRLPHRATGESFAINSELKIAVEDFELGTNQALWAISSVNPNACRRIVDHLKQSRSDDHIEVISHSQVPIEIVESYLNSVGIDRVVAAFAVSRRLTRSGNGTAIIVDAGTAVTVDVVNRCESTFRFEGGLIFPGFSSCLQALNISTADLPNISQSTVYGRSSGSIEPMLGATTNEAIENGVRLAQAHAVSGIVHTLYQQRPGAEVWITGGGAHHILANLSTELTEDWHIEPKLVLHGVKAIGQRVVQTLDQSQTP